MAHEDNPFITTASCLSSKHFAQIRSGVYRAVLQRIRNAKREATPCKPEGMDRG